jgi:preprotein translocase subunit SecA
MISRSIETAQKRVEAYHFESRKHVTEYDDVMNKQRQVIYNLRNKVLSNDAIDDEVRNMIQDQIEQVVLGVCDEKVKPIEWDLGLIQERFTFLFNKPFAFPADMQLTREAIAEQLSDAALSAYADKQADLKQKLRALAEAAASAGAVQQGEPLSFETFQQHTILETVDHFWLIHLQDMDHLREGIGLRGYGQKNPLYEYQRDGFTHFQTMLEHMSEAVIRKIFFIEVASPDEVRAQLAEEKRRRAKQEEAMRLTHPEAE